MSHAPSTPFRISAAAVFLATLLSSCTCLASAFVQGAYYRLGDADPGAAAGAIGNDPTVDSFASNQDLKRLGSPHYAADVPALGPAGDKLSMSFANIGLGGPAFPAAYDRSDPLPVVVQGIELEAWVKAGPTNLDVPTVGREELLAYNGDPAANGFGFFLSGDQYVARLGAPAAPVGGPASTGNDHVLGPATIGAWHHLAYVYSLGTSTYYYDGKPVSSSTTDPAPLAATSGFFLGGRPGAADAIQFGFNGWLDEVRYQSFNPIAAGVFQPDAFLITPEPTAMTLLVPATLLLLRRRGGWVERAAE